MRFEQVELERAFAQEQIVLVCWEPSCQMHRLAHWNEEKWVARPHVEGYQKYSHSICRSHYRLCQEEIQRYIAKEAAVSSVSNYKVAAV
ncbi:MAG: hypothetical protein ACI906_004070 [Candidatus Latescibacterota bacterium]|jgi:hypothetical protein